MPPELGHDKISVVVPVYNEANGIRSFLQDLRLRAPTAEIIVVDGESSDGTADLAASHCDRLIETKRGRSLQMNAGAHAASGNVLWFLHADTAIPSDATAQIEQVLRNQWIAGGYFRIQLPRDHIIYRLTDSFAHYAGMLLRIRCADHGFFCRRQVFQQTGGFPDVPLMDDVEFFRAMRRVGRVVALDSRLTVSARRYENVGCAKLTFAYGLIALLYAAGWPLRSLRKIYDTLCLA